MPKLKEWLNDFDKSPSAKLIDKLYILTISMFYIWAFLYLFVWSK